MLTLNVEWMIRLRGSKQPYSYLINHGFTEQEARTLLSGKTKRVKTEMLERLVLTFKCQLDDLFDWKGNPDHPLAQLRKPELAELEKLLDDKSPEDILAVLRQLGRVG